MELKDVARELREVKSAILATHISPDPDAVGSSCALALALEELGIAAQVFFPKELPAHFLELVEGVSVCHSIPAESFDLLVVTDAASKKRLGDGVEKLCALAPKIVNIDHHYTNDMWGDINFVDDRAAASAQIVQSLIEELGVSFNKKIANLLYAGILDDTGRFSFSNANSATLQAAAKLVENGAEPQFVGNALYFSVDERIIRFLSAATANLEVKLDGRISLLVVDKALMSEFSATSKDTEGLVDEARKVSGVIGAVFMRETDDGWKLSLRSKVDYFDVNEIAAHFDGGGHRQAAGCTINGSREEVVSRVFSEVEKVLAESS